jgi:PAS domain S-box-containing protein
LAGDGPTGALAVTDSLPPSTDKADPGTPRPAARLRQLLPVLLTALAYLLAGKLALLLAIPPSYAAPIYPSAGIALAAALTYGRPALLGVALGAFLVNLPLGEARALNSLSALGVPLASSVGAMLQAAVGTALIRWRLPGPLRLAEPRDVAMFCLLGAVVACLINASVSVPVLAAAGSVSATAVPFTWWTWWAGDTLGVLIGAPVALTLIGRPAADWVGRRITVAIPLLATTALLAAATVLVARWDQQRSQSVFDRDASAVAAAIGAQLRHASLALEALRGLQIGSDEVTHAELRRAAEPWLALPIQLQALGVSQRVARADLPAFEASTSRQLGRPYRVFDRPQPAEASVSANDNEVMAIRMIEPAAGNEAALGVNALSIPAAREAILRAARTDAPAATSGFVLTQEASQQIGVVLYRALYREDIARNATPAARLAALSGVVFVTLRMQQSVEAGMQQAPAYLRWCLVDANPDAGHPHLAGPPGCEADAPQPLRYASTIALGGQRWLLHIGAQASAVPDAGHGNAWLFSTVGLLSATMLSALLLTVTGRTRRIEDAVDERTADLQREAAERHQAESALRASEERFRNIFDHAPIGIVYADLQGHLRDANPRLREMIGYAGQALTERSLAELTHPDDRAEDAQGLSRLLAGELSEFERTSRLLHRDGQTLSVRMNWSVLRGPDGLPQRLVAVVEDITEQLRRQDAERGRQAAESANLAKNEFLSRMSHELRTPLNAMLGFAQLLDLDTRPPLAPHQRTWAAQILHAGWHLLEMINDTLDLSRIDAGMLRMALAPVPLQALVQQCVGMLEPAAARRSIGMQVQLDDPKLCVLGDETRLKQVLTNLLSNAVKYNVPGGRVVVHSQRLDADTVALRVLDTGLGLTDAQMANLFQPFNRLGREQGSIEGTGIGLVISRRLAELMGGSLQAERPEGQGATFVLTLPVAPAAPLQADETAPADTLAAPYRHRRVHYVEDNETNVEVMRGILAQRPQIQLDVSALGLDGLTAIRSSRPDLILLDMNLPDVDGLELLHQLQRDPDCVAIPVVVVSADATPGRIEDALAAGARRYMTKPLNLGSFLGMLDELLEGIDSRYG